MDPLQWLLADERGKLVRLGWPDFRGRDAEILLLKYSEDWSYRDIAANLGISHSALQCACIGHGSGCVTSWQRRM